MRITESLLNPACGRPFGNPVYFEEHFWRFTASSRGPDAGLLYALKIEKGVRAAAAAPPPPGAKCRIHVSIELCPCGSLARPDPFSDLPPPRLGHLRFVDNLSSVAAAFPLSASLLRHSRAGSMPLDLGRVQVRWRLAGRRLPQLSLGFCERSLEPAAAPRSALAEAAACGAGSVSAGGGAARRPHPWNHALGPDAAELVGLHIPASLPRGLVLPP